MKRKAHVTLFAGLAVLLLVQLACASFSPQVVVVTATSEPEQQVVRETVIVEVTPIDQPAATEAAVPTEAPAPTAQTAVETVVVTAPPPNQPSPTPLRLRTARIEGDTGKIRATIVWPDYGGPATTDLVFWVEARNPSVGKKDGAGIKSVDFVLTDSNGQDVYTHTENTSRYCGFGGGEPDCVVFHFADNNFNWPGTNLPIQNDDYTLTATVNSADGNQWSGSGTFSIRLP
jgi:hypothetical protein